MRRQGTNQSDNDHRSLRKRLTEPFSREAQREPAPARVTDKYPAYNGLMPWPKLKAYLLSQFPDAEYPDWKFNEEYVCGPYLTICRIL